MDAAYKPDYSYAADATTLRNGDHMSQQEFHAVYETMPAGFNAELIAGVVYVAMPVSVRHGNTHGRLNSLFDAYAAYTPGIQLGDNCTVILGDEDEVQPDLFLRVLPGYGGNSKDAYDRYVCGAPELVAEIAYSSRSIDLHQKKKRYAKAGVLEYLVLCLQPIMSLSWYLLQSGSKMLKPDNDGVYRSRFFPGLWIHEKALLELDYQRSMEVLFSGVKSDAHLDFVSKLANRKQVFTAEPNASD